MLYIVDYMNPFIEDLDCIIIEADSVDDAYDLAVDELKILQIPKRYILELEEFENG